LQGSRTRTSFLEGISLEGLLDNEFEQIASARGLPFTTTELYTPVMGNQRPS
jgi:hypothetical protein